MTDFFSVTHPEYYLITVFAGLIITYGLIVFSFGRRGLTMRLGALTLGAMALTGALCGRVLYLISETGMGFHLFKMENVREMAFMGVFLGAWLAAFLIGRLTRRDAILNAVAKPALFMIAMARFAEIFVTFGLGQEVAAPWLQFIPLAMPNDFLGYSLSVFLLEGLWALIALLLLYRPRFRGQEGHGLLLLFCSMQVFFETLRQETLQWGFVRVSQLLCALIILFVLIMMKDKGKIARVVRYLILAALYIGMNFALDRLPFPNGPMHLIMLALAVLILLNGAEGFRKDPAVPAASKTDRP